MFFGVNVSISFSKTYPLLYITYLFKSLLRFSTRNITFFAKQNSKKQIQIIICHRITFKINFSGTEKTRLKLANYSLGLQFTMAYFKDIKHIKSTPINYFPKFTN